jgi:hypothetical protein
MSVPGKSQEGFQDTILKITKPKIIWHSDSVGRLYVWGWGWDWGRGRIEGMLRIRVRARVRVRF